MFFDITLQTILFFQDWKYQFLQFFYTFEPIYGCIGVKIPYRWLTYCLPMSLKWWLVSFKDTSGLNALIFTSGGGLCCTVVCYIILLLLRQNLATLEWTFHIFGGLSMSTKWWLVCLKTWVHSSLILEAKLWCNLHLGDISFCYLWGKIWLNPSKTPM